MVDQRRFSDSAPGNNCGNIDLLVCPCIVQETDVLFTTKNITSCNGQSGDRNFLGDPPRRALFKHRVPTLGIGRRNVRSAKDEGYEFSQICRWLTSYGRRSGRGHFLQVLASDSTPRTGSIFYCRHRLEQLVRSLESLCWIFLKE